MIVHLPPDLSMLFDDLDRRVRALETSSEDGLSRSRSAWTTAAVDPTTFDAWESGAAGTTWADNQGNTGIGYPEMTVRTGRRALVQLSCRIINMASNPSFRTSAAQVGFGINSLLPDQLLGPTGQRALFVGSPSTHDQNVAFNVVRTDLTPGPNLFRVHGRWQNNVPAAPTAPRLTDVVLTVIPLDPPS